MRLVLLVAAVLAVANVASLSDSEIDEEWTAFMEKYSKSYQTSRKRRDRQQAFKENRQFIAQHNQRFQFGWVSYEMGVNQFTDLWHEEFVEIMLKFPTNATELKAGPDQNTLFSFVSYDSSEELSSTVDWRDKSAITHVKNQGKCGSSWAFAATGALEAQLYFKTKKLVELSEQNLVDCSNKDPNDGCGGGLMGVAYKYIKTMGGIQNEQSYPYRAVQQQCKFNPRYVAARVKGYIQIPAGNEQALMEAVATQGPVAVAIDASNPSFQNYHGGVYYEPDCNPNRLTHAFLVVGYGTSNGQDYWLVKNSWDVTWGERGYIKMARNRNNHCGISNYALYPDVLV